MDKKEKKEKEEVKSRDNTNNCCYVMDPCGCYSYRMDPCGCYVVDPCCC